MSMKRMLALVALPVCFICEAQALSLSFDADKVFIESGGNAGIMARVENTTQEMACFAVSAETNDERIEARLNITQICLQASESTEFRVDLASYGADKGTYYAEVAISGVSGSSRKMIDVFVEEEAIPIASDTETPD